MLSRGERLNAILPGQYFDKETGLHQNYFRDYDPSTGRYPQFDPIGLAGGINGYAYANQNPLSFIDPLGLSACGPGYRAVPFAGNEKNFPQVALCQPDPGSNPSEKQCGTAECAAGLPPTKSEFRPVEEIEQAICEMWCGVLWPGPIIPLSKAEVIPLVGGYVSSYYGCKWLCKNPKVCKGKD